jgi:hypothetical protein
MHLDSHALPRIDQPRAGTHELPIAAHEPATPARSFLRRGLLFTAIGLLLYLALYVVADQLVYQHTLRNRFYAIKTAPHAHYDSVILGASRAAVFDYEDMNARLEQLTGSKILNLSVVGGGLTINRLLLEYFLVGHTTSQVVYFVDSFVFYSRQWNEDRLNDVQLINRAPFDPALARLLLGNSATRSIGLDYILGFSKINNPDRFKLDISEDEATKFNTAYRPVRQIDLQRIRYLYPEQVDRAVFQHYLAEFEAFVQYLKERNIRLIVIKSPIPERVYRMLPNEQEFDAALGALLERYGVEFHDLSLAVNDERLYYNTDHLNRMGVLYFYDHFLGKILSGRTIIAHVV